MSVVAEFLLLVVRSHPVFPRGAALSVSFPQPSRMRREVAPLRTSGGRAINVDGRAQGRWRRGSY
eukprot:9056868-Pyramimonas_sp.AAC.1